MQIKGSKERGREKGEVLKEMAKIGVTGCDGKMRTSSGWFLDLRKRVAISKRRSEVELNRRLGDTVSYVAFISIL
jgi:hypothetical protein